MSQEWSGVLASSNKVVLVIEDNESNMKLLHDLLELNGYAVLQASEGIEGWNCARRHQPDLILLDIQLPDISGLGVARLLKEHEELKSIPIIAVTAFALEGDQEKILSSGCDAYVSKPISLFSLMQKVQSLMVDGNSVRQTVH